MLPLYVSLYLEMLESRERGRDQRRGIINVQQLAFAFFSSWFISSFVNVVWFLYFIGRNMYAASLPLYLKKVEILRQKFTEFREHMEVC
jgi:hypothetical protein